MRIERGAEAAAEIAAERIEPDVILGQSVLVVDIEFAPALGLPDVDPIGGTVAGADEPIGLDEGLQQQGGRRAAGQPLAGLARRAVLARRGGSRAGSAIRCSTNLASQSRDIESK